MKSETIQLFADLHRTRLAMVLMSGLLAGGHFPVISSAAAATAVKAAAAQPPDADSQTIQYSSGNENISAYLVRPTGSDKHPAVIVVHDLEGLNDEARDVAQKFADAGFVALVPDLSRGGGAKAIPALSLGQPVSDLDAAFAYLKSDSIVDTTKISVVGFGWGGWRVYKMAEDNPGLYKAAVFYAVTPTDDGLKNIHASILAHYAQNDFKITGNAIWTEKELGKKFKYYVYPETEHGFFSLNPKPEYAENSKLAWSRTLEFLK